MARHVAGTQAARQALKDAKDEADYREHNFQKELATSQKLAALYKEANDERSRKVTELEGVIRELQDHLKVRRTAALASVGGVSLHGQWACLASACMSAHILKIYRNCLNRMRRRRRRSAGQLRKLALWLLSRRLLLRGTAASGCFQLQQTATCLFLRVLVRQHSLVPQAA